MIFLTLSHLFLSFSSFVLPVISSEEVLGCGGFIRIKKENSEDLSSNLDFSRIYVQLHSKQGSLKYKTDCAPLNGYYFIPIYDTGDYVLKVIPPGGWVMEPNEISIHFDGKTDPCSRNEDINFIFRGFGVSGQVLSAGQNEGPSSVPINLIDSHSNKILGSTTTTAKGFYTFPGVPPGKYLIKAHSSNYQFEEDFSHVEVGTLVTAPHPLIISGYDISGRVLDRYRKAFEGILVYCEGRGQVTTNDEGVFIFKSLKMREAPYEFLLESNIDVSPKSLSISLKNHNHVTLETPFVISSFSLKGQIQLSSPIQLRIECIPETSEGSILESISELDGTFVLSFVERQNYVLRVIGTHGYFFDEVSLFGSGPSTRIPLLRPSRYIVSGTVSQLPTSSLEGELRIQFKSIDGTLLRNVHVSENGSFSSYFPPSQLIVSVEVSSTDRKKGLGGYSPLTYSIEIINKPIQNINFSPIILILSGEVRTFDESTSTFVFLKDNSIEGLLLKTLVVKGQFSFDTVLPGSYSVYVENDKFRCWETPILNILLTQNETSLVFEQKGLLVTLESTHALVARLNDLSVSLSPGKNSICLTPEKEIALSVLQDEDSCTQFDINPNKLFPSRKQSKVTFTAISHRVSGSISSNNQLNDLSVHVVENDNSVIDVGINEIDYSFFFQAVAGKTYVVTPKASEHLFTPSHLILTMGHNCLLNSMSFTAKEGIFQRGKVIPPLKDVKITLSNELWTLTNEEGLYSIGPLSEEERLSTLKAEKNGYLFTLRESDGVFEARKLASIYVHLSEHLSGVVVSLSGEGNYRRNAISKDGLVNFTNLEPGKYFLKPMLKEFEFTPKSEILSLEEGETQNVFIEGKRTSFSLYGKVVSLNDDVESGVPLLAEGYSVHCGHEETLSDFSGEFRLRGLKPGCTYNVKLHKKIISSVETLLPENSVVLIDHGDVSKNLSLTALRKSDVMDVSCIVHPTTISSPSSIKVSLTSQFDNSLTHVVKGWEGHIIVLPSLPLVPSAEYRLSVESYHDKYSYKKFAVSYFFANETYKLISLVLNDKVLETSKNESSSGYWISWILLSFLIVICLSYFFGNDVFTRLLELFERKNQEDSNSQNFELFSSRKKIKSKK